jgi:hypothetical protein
MGDLFGFYRRAAPCTIDEVGLRRLRQVVIESASVDSAERIGSGTAPTDFTLLWKFTRAPLAASMPQSEIVNFRPTLQNVRKRILSFGPVAERTPVFLVHFRNGIAVRLSVMRRFDYFGVNAGNRVDSPG